MSLVRNTYRRQLSTNAISPQYLHMTVSTNAISPQYLQVTVSTNAISPQYLQMTKQTEHQYLRMPLVRNTYRWQLDVEPK